MAAPDGVALAEACAGKDGWSDPAPPARIAGNTYYVGTCGIASVLVTSAKGHILIDGATAEAAPQIAANIRKLGFDPKAVKFLLSSHEHVDHAGGLAALKRLTGARLVARAEAQRGLERGTPDPSDPQAGTIASFEGVKVDRVVRDGEEVRIETLHLKVHATPGHTAGSTSWSWQLCEKGSCRNIVYADSLTAVGPERFRFTGDPALVARFRASFARVAAMPCDILITPHPGASNLFERLAGRAPLADRNACVAYSAAAAKRLDERLAAEAKR
ncbi:MAG: subclass B3 metallo-beta-lactamase [Alphaproteobacteria bacterium]|nr:MAG: subclass B3 metallo-beta-lactamase [Alphaproteobacteria bacterium]